ncbi:MAG: tRNA 2-thiouridine(34) synthase MnmA [Candidatus Omnitrophica bacterium]|nr:tRNA 2-thiouridine(34) synthase MnmA [Candidatus Omnitrophota bacterium]
MKTKIAVGLSGGIDSSFAAYLLKRKGYDVVGFTLKFLPRDNRCCDLDSLYQAQRLCQKLDIPHYVLDVDDLFNKEIVRYFINSYLQGLTPNPCAFCNRLIKFGLFFEKAKALGCDYLATGHYARIVKLRGRYSLQEAKDKKKSQEYFLSLINPQILPRLIFPLGNYTKGRVKIISAKEKLLFKERKESQDICFVTEKPYSKFIAQHLQDTRCYEGAVRHVNGNILGKHKGIYCFTYGQREGLGISWKVPLYVIDIDPAANTVIVGEREYLYRDSFSVKNCNWFIEPVRYKKIKVKVRYNSPLFDCALSFGGTSVHVALKEKISAIAPGQVAAFYHNDILLGGGIIEK